MEQQQQVIDLLRDRFADQGRRFDAQDEMLRTICETIRTHTEKDEKYWKKIDDQEAQIRLVKWLGSGGVLGSVALWLWQKIGH